MSVNLGQLAATTLRNRRDEVADAVTNNNALLSWFREAGRIETREGGRTFVEPIIYNENQNAKFYDGGLESFSITVEENIDASEWARKFQAAFVYFTEAERMANRGKAAVVKLLKTKIKAAKATLANDMSTAVYAAGTVSNQPVGLQAQIADNPTTGTLGGIDASTYTWWRNQYKTGTTATSSNIKTLLNEMYLSTYRGMDHPDLFVAGTDMFTYYHDSLSDQQRFMKWDKADVIDFSGLCYQKGVVLHDPSCNTKRLYGLDTSDLTFVCDPGKRWTTGDSRMVTNGTYEVVPIGWSGAFVMERRQSHFVINGT